VDFDFVCTQDEYEQWIKDNRNKVSITKEYDVAANGTIKHIIEGSPNIEFEIVKDGTSSALLRELVEKDPETMEAGVFAKIPNLDLLFTIKDSHKFKKFETQKGASMFWKTACDWHMMKKIGTKVRPEYEEFLKLRERETYTHKLPSLNMSKNDFFDETKNGVHQVYVHDDIHAAIAINDRPAYTHYLKDDSEVLTDNKKFFECSEEIRLAGVIEEAMTLAIERSLVCHGTWKPDYAFGFALAKVASTITGGQFRSYAYSHLFEALKAYPKDYWEKFQQAVKDGKVRRLEQAA
jgi:hypothetical protein